MPMTATPCWSSQRQWLLLLRMAVSSTTVLTPGHPGSGTASICSPGPIDDQEAQFKHQPGRLVHANHDSARGEPPGEYSALRSLLTIRGIFSFAELIPIGSPLLDVMMAVAQSSATPPLGPSQRSTFLYRPARCSVDHHRATLYCISLPSAIDAD